VKDYNPPRLARKAVVHGHCHHKAVMKTDAEESVLDKLGLDFEVLDSGCCGMAGSFGFEREHYDVSVAVGELVLLPAVRAAAKDTLIIANGFSCRKQIEQCTDRKALHLAEVIRMAMTDGPDGPQGEYPERHPLGTGCVSVARRPSAAGTALAFGAGVVLGGLAAWALTRRTST
jgi:hypothetical protein